MFSEEEIQVDEEDQQQQQQQQTCYIDRNSGYFISVVASNFLVMILFFTENRHASSSGDFIGNLTDFPVVIEFWKLVSI